MEGKRLRNRPFLNCCQYFTFVVATYFVVYAP